MILPALAGILIIASVLWEAFEAVVLPRRATRRFRITRMYYRASWIPWRWIARRIRANKTREAFLSFYGPLSLLFLFIFWAIGLVFGYAFLYYAASRHQHPPPNFMTCAYFSGSTIFTLGLGDIAPQGWAERWLAVAESGLGFGFLALVFSYLPVIYQAFSRREVNIVLLDARAGSPPTAAELLRRHVGSDGMAQLQQLLHDWERASAEILESHISYPAVAYFRSQHDNESWLAAITAILDVSALLMASVEDACARQARLTFAMCRHTVVDIAQLFSATPRPADKDRLPPGELRRLRESLLEAGFQLRESEAANTKLHKLREMYDPYLQGLSRFLFMDLPPWILAKEITDNWRTSAWGRISGFTTPVHEEVAIDDHGD